MLAWLVTFALTSLVFLGGWLAYQDQMLTVLQMKQKGVTLGLPFLAHGGMWGDLLIINILLMFIVPRHGNSWSTRSIVIALMIGTTVSVIMHFSYLNIKWPEAHVQNGRLTRAGWVHLVYMAGIMGVLVLFYFYTPNPSPRIVIATSALLLVHLVLGLHFVLGLIKPSWYPGRPLSDPATWITLGSSSLLLAWRTWYLIR